MLCAQHSDSTKLKLDVSLNGNISEGNSARWILINRIGINYKFGNGFTTIEHSDYYLYGKVQGRRFENNLLDRTILNFNANKKVIPFAAFFLESYPIRNLDVRWQPGLGVKYQLIQKKGLLIEPAVMFSRSYQKFKASRFKDFDNDDSDEIETNYLTAIVNLKAQLFNGKLMLINNFWYQYDLDGNENHRLFYDAKAIVKLNDTFGLQLIMTNYWENVVQSVRGEGPVGPPIEKNDFVIAYGISAKLSK